MEPTPPHAAAALVLVGMSIREVTARAALVSLADQYAGPELVTVAFLQTGDPSLHRELSRLADAGHARIELVGVSLGTLAPAASWLRRIAAHWWRERGGNAPVIEVATALMTGTSPADLELAREVRRPLTGAEAGLTSAAWEHVTGHRHQVLICRGPRCTALGSDTTAEAMILALMRAGQSDDDVLVTHTGCQFPCNQAPVVSVQPDDVWYGGVTPQVGEQVVAEHLVGGNPVAAYRLSRR